nr:MAG TPA: hypothetical protein [Caudoviricetes sp.]
MLYEKIQKNDMNLRVATQLLWSSPINSTI